MDSHEKIFFEIFMFFSIPQVIPALLNIMFAWSYHPNISTHCYKPSKVFREFEFPNCITLEDTCICHSLRRFSKFIDIDTLGQNNEKRGIGHVRTMDIVQHKGLRQTFTMGLNHIPLRPTHIHEVIQVILDTFL